MKKNRQPTKHTGDAPIEAEVATNGAAEQERPQLEQALAHSCSTSTSKQATRL